MTGRTAPRATVVVPVCDHGGMVDTGGAARTRRSREELRDPPLDAGRPVLAECGLGLRVPAPLPMRQFTAEVSAMVERRALRRGGDPDPAVIVRSTGPGGTPREWTVFGVCPEALAFRFFENDPERAAVTGAAA